MKTSELIGPALDWAVAKCEDIHLSQASLRSQIERNGAIIQIPSIRYTPSTNWNQGGPIIDRERILIEPHSFTKWCATYKCPDAVYDGPTPLIAAMRCFVASKLGNEVDVPKELK